MNPPDNFIFTEFVPNPNSFFSVKCPIFLAFNNAVAFGKMKNYVYFNHAHLIKGKTIDS